MGLINEMRERMAAFGGQAVEYAQTHKPGVVMVGGTLLGTALLLIGLGYQSPACFALGAGIDGATIFAALMLYKRQSGVTTDLNPATGQYKVTVYNNGFKSVYDDMGIEMEPIDSKTEA